jgi:hypothetical protein
VEVDPNIKSKALEQVERDDLRFDRRRPLRHCERSETIQGRQQRTGLLPPSLFELRRTQSSQGLLAMTESTAPNQLKLIRL